MKIRFAHILIVSSLFVSGCAGGMRAPIVDASISNSDTNGVVEESAGVDVDASVGEASVESSDVVITALGDVELSSAVLSSLGDEEVSSTVLPALAPEVIGDDAPNPAVAALLNNANAQTQAGRHDQAAASLERAVKIEPKNAWVWHWLARSRLQLGELDQAQSLAARSNSFARNDRRLLSDNWSLIAEARQRGGDQAGARAAQLRAAQFTEG